MCCAAGSADHSNDSLQTWLTGLCGVSLVLAAVSANSWVAVVAVLFGSYFALRTAWASVSAREIDVNLLMVLAAAGAVVVGRPIDAAALLFLFSLSGTLESYAMSKTRSAIEGLIKLRPDRAIRIEGEGEEKVSVESLRLGDLVRVPPFESVPVDGVVLEGTSSVDQSAMTGESVAVTKTEGDLLIGGTRNLEGIMVMRVSSTVGDSTLDKIVSLVREAQDNKASGERISSWFGQRYTVFVLGVFILSFFARSLFAIPVGEALYASITLLVALSPCALVISTPATTLSALAWAGRNGMLVRGGQYIELLGKVDTVVLDKTGTVTVGRPRLEEICLCAGVTVGAAGACGEDEPCWRRGGPMSREALELLGAAAAVEAYSSHPVAEAVAEAASRFGVAVKVAEGHTEAPGLGVSARVDGREVHVGQLRYLEQAGVDLPGGFLDHVRHLQDEGLTVALVSAGDRLGAMGFIDAPRDEALPFLEKVQAIGVERTLMVTGDNTRTAEAVASAVGIGEVHAALLPHQKAEILQKLRSEGRTNLMVGDGINDAPSLASAHVGVAMGGLGSDVALNAADVVLMNDRLDRIPDLMRLGRKTNRIIRANLFFAAGVIVLLTVLSLFWALPLPLAVIGHEGSTVIVILNGLRLLRGP
jgi:Zn2+/Cd2+-exporting ATPase